MENQLNSVHLDISRGAMKADAIGFASFGALFLLLSLLPGNQELFLWSALLHSPYFIAAFLGYKSSKSHHKSTLGCYNVILMIICCYFVILAVLAIVLFSIGFIVSWNFGCDYNNDNCGSAEGIGWLFVLLLGFMGLLLTSSSVLIIFAIVHSNKTIRLLSGKMKKYQEPLMDQQAPPVMNPIYPQQMNQGYY